MHIERLNYRRGQFELAIERQVIALPGRCTAVIGENGAGKSTLFRILAGAINAQGSFNTGDEKQKVLFHDAFAQLNKRLRVSDHVNLTASLHQTPKLRVDEVVADFNLLELWSCFPPALSAGQLTRLRLAKTLLAEPDVVLLDEPTTGLQYSAAEQVVRCISLLLSQGKSVVVSTHHLIELSPLKPYLVGLKAGKVVLSEPWSERYENYAAICELMRTLSALPVENTIKVPL